MSQTTLSLKLLNTLGSGYPEFLPKMTNINKSKVLFVRRLKFDSPPIHSFFTRLFEIYGRGITSFY